ncbi:MAG: sulfatase-like hydrolase/transferase [Bacteroidales bacterium]|nr:sulfatase-like hydrolase/transferase [Bacteroidales bacterium]
MKETGIFKSFLNLVFDILLVYICYTICRILFLTLNYSFYEGKILTDNFFNLVKGSLVFDTSGILYTNMIFLLLALFPLHLKENSPTYAKIVKIVYVSINTLGIIANLCDVVYFRFTGRRTTGTVFSEFGNEDNLFSIIFTEAFHSWYLIIAAVIMALLLIFLYKNPLSNKPLYGILSFIKYYTLRIVFVLITVALCAIGMRGGIDRSTRPITLSNANQYITSPVEAPLILNTPFSIIRTINKKPFQNPNYFSEEELESIYTPLHQPVDSIVANAKGKGKNVVVFIVESFAREFIKSYNPDSLGGNYQSYTPFVDSLMQHSVWFMNSYTNGRKSIDGMPSVLSSIPYFIEPFFVTPAALNNLSGIARELKNEGYYSAFFHGAKNGSMGFQAFSNATGFDDYFGRTEFDQSKRFGGEAEFDGYWAIWDEPFLQYFCAEMGFFQQPFVSAVFTATSHHPFQIPEKYEGKFPEGTLEVHKCIGYTDYALRRFFEEAKKQPWYNNTVFVITNDHTNLTEHPEYQTDLGVFTGPVIFFSPGDPDFKGCHEGLAQQIDIMPTLLGYLGYNRPYIAFGQDLLNTPKEETFVVNYPNGVYQFAKNGYVIQFDGEKTTAVYALTDKLMQNNILGTVDITDMERQLKAIIQQYMSRMNENRMTVNEIQ